MEHQRQYVGIDLHRRRSVIVRINDAGEVLETVRVVNDPLKLALAMAEAGDNPEVALEATLFRVDASFDLLVGTNARCCAYYLTQRFGA